MGRVVPGASQGRECKSCGSSHPGPGPSPQRPPEALTPTLSGKEGPPDGSVQARGSGNGEGPGVPVQVTRGFLLNCLTLPSPNKGVFASLTVGNKPSEDQKPVSGTSTPGGGSVWPPALLQPFWRRSAPCPCPAGSRPCPKVACVHPLVLPPFPGPPIRSRSRGGACSRSSQGWGPRARPSHPGLCRVTPAPHGFGDAAGGGL